jgi:hypothetical protein
MHLEARLAGASAVLAAAWFVPALDAQIRPTGYAPGSYRYAISTVVERVQDQAAGRPPFAFETETRQWITLGLSSRSPDTLALTITVDSVTVSSSLAAPAPTLDKLRGVTLTGTVSPMGRIHAFLPASDASPEAAALYGAFRAFLPPLPSEALSARSRWVDTTSDRVRREGLDVTTRTVTTSRVTGDTTIAGERAWRIERSAVIEGKGTGTEAGKPLRVRNDGTIAGTHYVSARGVYLGSASTQRSELALSAGEGDASMPILQTIKSSVTLLPPPR